MKEETTLNAQESLTLIMQVISQTKENLKQHSFIFLLWGWLLSIASIVRFVFQTETDFKYYFIPFPILALIGIVSTVVFYKRKEQRPPETHLNYFIKRLWLVMAAGFAVIVFVSVYQNVVSFTYTLILAGVGTFVTGLVMKFNPFLTGGICFFISAVCCVFVPDEYKVLIHGGAIIAGYIIPGYLLKNSKQ
ncbi:MAG: hypothetical protein V4557_19440 [Bacteroidota bacterium]